MQNLVSSSNQRSTTEECSLNMTSSYLFFQPGVLVQNLQHVFPQGTVFMFGKFPSFNLREAEGEVKE